jgi:hypothetical protein
MTYQQVVYLGNRVGNGETFLLWYCPLLFRAFELARHKKARGWWSCFSIGSSSCLSCIYVTNPSLKRSESSVKTQILLYGSCKANVIDSMIADCKSLKVSCSFSPQVCTSDTAAAAFLIVRRLIPSNAFTSAALRTATRVE